MTNEEHELLVRALCECLPNNVICETEDGIGTLVNVEPTSDLVYVQFRLNANAEEYEIWDGTVKPYLRPMSSMTEEEKSKLRQWGCLCMKPNDVVEDIDSYIVEDVGVYGAIHSIPVIDYLNSIHVDCRGLILKGLANVALEGMYEIN